MSTVTFISLMYGTWRNRLQGPLRQTRLTRPRRLLRSELVHHHRCPGTRRWMAWCCCFRRLRRSAHPHLDRTFCHLVRLGVARRQAAFAAPCATLRRVGLDSHRRNGGPSHLGAQWAGKRQLMRSTSSWIRCRRRRLDQDLPVALVPNIICAFYSGHLFSSPDPPASPANPARAAVG
jgi:hypothetical protein